MKRLMDLSLRLCDGTASEAECRELERLTESDRRARRKHLEMMEIEATLRATAEPEHDSLAEERTVQAVMEGIGRISVLRPTARPRFAARPIWALLALGGLAASIGIAVVPHTGSKRRGTGPLAFARSRAGSEATLGPAARAGWTPATVRIEAPGSEEVARLGLDDGATLEVRGRATVRALDRAATGGATRVVVEDGTVALVSAAPTSTVFVTPHAEVRARARRLLLAVTGETTRIDVDDGTAQVRRSDGEALELGNRQSALVADREELAVRPLRSVLFLSGHLGGRHPTDLLDRVLVRRLEGLGFAVDSVDELDLRPADVADRALIFISPSTSGVLAGKIDELSLAAVGTPIICSRPALFPQLSMTAPEGEGSFTANATRLEILAPAHPLAAGYSGPLQVTRAPGNLGWGRPGPGAVRIATFPDRKKSDRSVIFAYDRDAPMAGSVMRAPARRVGFFVHPDLAPYLTEPGWALLDAAVRWAAGGDAR
jgi:hypothetical protein